MDSIFVLVVAGVVFVLEARSRLEEEWLFYIAVVLFVTVDISWWIAIFSTDMKLESLWLFLRAGSVVTVRLTGGGYGSGCCS